jgi:hypothetical protein
MSPQRPAPAARDADEMMVPCRIGVVIASRMLAAGASATVRLGRGIHPAGSPCQATPGTRPVVDTRIDTRHLHRRNGFEPATRRTSGNNHAASGFGRAGRRLRIGKERCGHSASHGWLSTEALLVRPAAAGRAQGKAKTTHCITKTTKEAVCSSEQRCRARSGSPRGRLRHQSHSIQESLHPVAALHSRHRPGDCVETPTPAPAAGGTDKTSPHVSTVVVPRVHGYRTRCARPAEADRK